VTTDHPRLLPAIGRHGIRYSFNAWTFTNVRIDARLSQNSLQPGASITISATLAEYGILAAHRANMRAERELLDNTRATLALGSRLRPFLGQQDHNRFRSLPNPSGGVRRHGVGCLDHSRATALMAAVLGSDKPRPTHNLSRETDTIPCWNLLRPT
jgi:hypothetical protein